MSTNPKRDSSLQPDDLIRVARQLIATSRGRPSQAALRRAVSTAYYAVFHALARNCADMLIGRSKSSRSRHAWDEVYRSLSHGTSRSACEHRATMSKFPSGIVDLAEAFLDLQHRRHDADYNPSARFEKSLVIADIDRAEGVIRAFLHVAEKDKRAFASWVLLKNVTNRNR